MALCGESGLTLRALAFRQCCSLRYYPGAGLGADKVGNPAFRAWKSGDFFLLQPRPDLFPYLFLASHVDSE